MQLQKQIRQNNNAVLDRIGQKTDKIAQFVNSNMVVKTIESVCLVVQSMKTVQKSTHTKKREIKIKLKKETINRPLN